jgi:hypothetical protein
MLWGERREGSVSVLAPYQGAVEGDTLDRARRHDPAHRVQLLREGTS